MHRLKCNVECYVFCHFCNVKQSLIWKCYHYLWKAGSRIHCSCLPKKERKRNTEQIWKKKLSEVILEYPEPFITSAIDYTNLPHKSATSGCHLRKHACFCSFLWVVAHSGERQSKANCWIFVRILVGLMCVFEETVEVVITSWKRVEQAGQNLTGGPNKPNTASLHRGGGSHNTCKFMFS